MCMCVDKPVHLSYRVSRAGQGLTTPTTEKKITMAKQA